MGYSTGMLRWMVTILKKKDTANIKFGETTTYEKVAQVHANKTWKKGQKALNEGSLDNVDTAMFRMRWNSIITRDCLLECEGVTYQIQSMNTDRHDNTIQITATEMVTK